MTSPLPERTYAGMLIAYRLRPLPGPPVTWATEVTHVDEQRLGPYRFRHRQPLSREIRGGVEVRGIAHSTPPPGTAPARAPRVAPRPERTFDGRRRVMEAAFGPFPVPRPSA